MKTDKLQEVLSWIKTTDLVEVGYKEGKEGFSFQTAEAAPALPALPQSRFTPVCAAAVGLFQWSKLGHARKAEEGAEVAQGDVLGVIEAGKNQSTPIKAPCAGRVARVFIEAGQPVEYGQPLLFLEPS